jgi:hypothetical protein
MMVASFATVALAAACGGGGSGGGDPDAGSSEETCTPGSPFDLDMRAGVLATLNVHVDASGLVETDTTAELMLLLDVSQDNTDVGVIATLCDIQIPEIPLNGQPKPLRFEAGPGLIDSVASVSGVASLDGTTTCSILTSEDITLVLGARLSDPANDALPEADDTGAFTECPPAGANCELAIGTGCACDQESDGNPGATLLAMNTPAVDFDEVYVNLRTTFSLAGEVWSSDLVVGEIECTLEQGILGCHKGNNEDCNAAEVGAVKNLNPDITAQPGNPSTFRAVRVADTLSCAELLEMRDTLFPR